MKWVHPGREPQHHCQPRLDGFIAAATRLSFGQTMALTVPAIAATGLADFLAGPELWFGPVYLLAILLPAWVIGWRAGIVAGIACMAVSLAANGMSVYPLGTAAVAWNIAMRVLAMSIIVVLTGGSRRSYDREWASARCDGLTGLFNTQGFYEETARCHDARKWAILVYLDLDGFKEINDRHGHAAGDETLRTFSDGLKASVRDRDILARVGGDEFVLHIFVRDEAHGHDLARQLHLRMNEILAQAAHPARCSVGVLVIPPRQTRLNAADIRIADRLMYQAKADGAALRTATIGNVPAEAIPAPRQRPREGLLH